MILNHQKFDFKNKCLIEKVVIEAPFRLVTEFQDEACFIYFLEGKAKVNSPGEQFLVETGGSVLLKCGSYFADMLKYGASDKYEILVFHLYPELLRKIYEHQVPAFVKPSPDKSYMRKVVSNDVVKKFVESLFFYFDNPSLVSDELLELKIKELILLLLQTENAKSVAALFSDLFTPRNLSLKEIVNNHIFSDLAVGDLARLCNLSLSTFNRTFQTLFDDTPANYIRKKRLERGKELLEISSLSVSEIAMQTCFNDVAHFSRSFKALYHCSPSEYKASL